MGLIGEVISIRVRLILWGFEEYCFIFLYSLIVGNGVIRIFFVVVGSKCWIINSLLI